MSSSVITYNTRSSNSRRKKRVRFHRDTILDDSDHIALTITRHSFIYDKGYTQYFIKLLCRGVEWTLHKRYRDFYNLHHELIKENQNYNIELPKLPEKRWFERQRWINRADEKYGWIRRIQLQDYLRAIVKIRVLRNESLSFWKFICMPKRAMTGPATAEEQERENNRSISMDSRQSSVKSSNGAGALTAAELSSLKGKLPSGASNSQAPSLEPEAQFETDLVLDNESDGYNPDVDLELLNESSDMAAREAILRGLYGPKTPKADVDNIGNLATKSHHPEPNLVSPGALKLNRAYDDDGEEISNDAGDTRDLNYIAISNAALNKRLTSKDAFASPGGASRTPISHVNKIWSGSEIAAALDVINTEEFDTALHFSGPRSGPPSEASPNASIASASGAAIDLNRTDLNIMPVRSDRNGSFAESKRVTHSNTSKASVPSSNSSATVSPPMPPTEAETTAATEKKRRGSQTKKPK